MNKQLQNINWKLLFMTRRYLVSVVFSCVLAILIIFFGIIPQFHEVLGLNNSIKQEQQRLKVLQQKAADLETIQASGEYLSHQQAVAQILPSKKPLLELLTALSSIAGQNQISFVDLILSPGKIASEGAELSKSARVKKTKTAPYDVLEVELKIAGTFSHIQHFLLEIEKVAPLTTITNLTLDIKGADILQPNNKVKASLVLNTYYFTKSIKVALDASLPVLDSREQATINEIQSYTYPSVVVQPQIVSGNMQDLFGFLSEESLSF